MIGWKRSWTYGALALLAAPCGVQADECDEVNARFNATLQRKDLSAAMKIEDEFTSSTTLLGACGSALLQDFWRGRAELQVSMAEGMKNDPAREAVRKSLLLEADKTGRSWRAAAGIGEIYMDKKQYGKAVDAFERAITIVNDELTQDPPKPETWQQIHQFSYAAKAFAAGFDPSRSRANEVAGSLGRPPKSRALVIKEVPLPIQFETGRDDLTSDGMKYAKVLAQAVQQQEVSPVVLEGHTDDRGTDAYNDQLSKKRVERVAAYLKQQGVTARIVIEAKGKREPYTPPAGLHLSQDQTWALNRRVVWHRPD